MLPQPYRLSRHRCFRCISSRYVQWQRLGGSSRVPYPHFCVHLTQKLKQSMVVRVKGCGRLPTSSFVFPAVAGQNASRLCKNKSAVVCPRHTLSTSRSCSSHHLSLPVRILGRACSSSVSLFRYSCSCPFIACDSRCPRLGSVGARLARSLEGSGPPSPRVTRPPRAQSSVTLVSAGLLGFRARPCAVVEVQLAPVEGLHVIQAVRVLILDSIHGIRIDPGATTIMAADRGGPRSLRRKGRARVRLLLRHAPNGTAGPSDRCCRIAQGTEPIRTSNMIASARARPA